jgi:hypothetical protein
MSKDKVNWDYVNAWKKDPNPLGGKEAISWASCLRMYGSFPELK